MRSFLFKAMAVIAIIVTVSCNAKAQTSFSCYSYKHCLLDDEGEALFCNEYEELSLFVFNDSETMITHTTESAKSTYYVKDKSYDGEDETYSYSVVSDSGSNYILHVDPGDMTILVLYTDEDDDLWAVLYNVKAIF